MESGADSVAPVIFEIRATRIEIRATGKLRQKSEFSRAAEEKQVHCESTSMVLSAK
jgi:hypothetical protein